MTEQITTSLLVFSRTDEGAYNFVASLFDVTEWLDVPERVDILDWHRGTERRLNWSQSKKQFTLLGENEILFVRPQKNDNASHGYGSISYEFRRNRSLFDISIPLQVVSGSIQSRVESWLVNVFRLSMRLGPSVLATGSEVSMSLDLQTEGDAVAKALDKWFNALWIAASRKVIPNRLHGYKIACRFLRHCVLLRSDTALKRLKLVPVRKRRVSENGHSDSEG